jgi:hemerythrin-like domain-containing protein
MQKVLKQLILDHMQLERVLSCLERQINNYVNDTGEEPSLDLIQDAIEYIRAYPDAFHHPLEEMVLDKLLTRVDDQKVVQKLRQIKNQHVILGRLTKRLAADIDAVAQDQVVSLDEIEDAFANFYDFQIEHLNSENEHFFPLIEKHFREQELEDLVAGNDTLVDPMFVARQAEFERLYDYIVECEGGQED